MSAEDRLAMPTWQKTGSMDYTIRFDTPKWLKEILVRTWMFPEIHVKIEAKLQHIVNCCFPIIEKLTIEFSNRGINIEKKPGDRCTFSVLMDMFPNGYSHNVDTAEDCLALYYSFVVCLEEIYNYINIITRSQRASTFADDCTASIVVSPDNQFVPLRLWRVKENDNPDMEMLVVAQTRQDVRDYVEEILEQPIGVDLIFNNKGPFTVSRLSIYTVLIRFVDEREEDGLSQEEFKYRVVACDSTQAEEYVGEYIKNTCLHTVGSMEVTMESTCIAPGLMIPG